MKTTVENQKVVKMSAKEVTKQIADNKRKTLERRAENKSVNAEAKQAPVQAKKDGIVYLKEGVTGKQFTQGKRDTNSAVKQDRATLSRCISDAIAKDKGFFDSLNLSRTALKSILRPAALLAHAPNSKLIIYAKHINSVGYVRFNVWDVLTYIKSELDGKKPNENAVLFFEGVNAGNTEAVQTAIDNAINAVNTAKAKKAAKK